MAINRSILSSGSIAAAFLLASPVPAFVHISQIKRISVQNHFILATSTRQGDDEANLEELHRSVSSLDPKWYEEFILKTSLLEDVLESSHEIGGKSEDSRQGLRENEFCAPDGNNAKSSSCEEVDSRGHSHHVGFDEDRAAMEGSRNSTAEQDMVILYHDIHSRSLVAAPLVSVLQLGYDVKEIPFIQPDALSFIIEEALEKPRRGIPRQWMMSTSQQKLLADDVRIVSRDEGEQIIETAARRAPKRKKTSRRAQTSSSRSTRKYSEGGKKARQATEEAAARRRADLLENSPWMDLDTFKSLLRREAELRVRILGDDWADTVQKESNWRLRIYKEWLWSISDDSGRVLRERGRPTDGRSQRFRKGRRTLDAAMSNKHSTNARKVLDPRTGPKPIQSRRTRRRKMN